MSLKKYTRKNVLRWACETFGDIAISNRERALRFLEEAVEVGQAAGLEKSQVSAIIRRCYSNSPGRLPKEIGQARMCLDALAEHNSINPKREAADEFNRVQRFDKAHWHKRHRAKVDLGIALPVTLTPGEHPSWQDEAARVETLDLHHHHEEITSSDKAFEIGQKLLNANKDSDAEQIVPLSKYQPFDLIEYLWPLSYPPEDDSPQIYGFVSAKHYGKGGTPWSLTMTICNGPHFRRQIDVTDPTKIRRLRVEKSSGH